jgi:hypothetical protein
MLIEKAWKSVSGATGIVALAWRPQSILPRQPIGFDNGDTHARHFEIGHGAASDVLPTD